MICIVAGPIPPAALARLAGHEPDVRFVLAADAASSDTTAAEAIFAWDFRRPVDDLLARTPRVRWVHAASAGVDHLLTPALRSRDVAVSNSVGVFERPIAEYVLALVLAHAKGILGTHDAQQDRRWAYRETQSVAGATMLVIGAGRIGRAVAGMAGAAGMFVVGVRRRDGSPEPPFAAIVGVAKLDEVLPDADYVVIAAAATPDTRHLVDRASLALLRPTSFLINVARGSLLDEAALVDALRDGRLAGAALDVFEQEPLTPDSPLWSAPNLFVSPHMSADAAGWDQRVVDGFLDNLRCLREGRPLPSAVDSSRGY